MRQILPHYEITEQTLALIPTKHIDYKTIAYDDGKKLYIKKSPFEIIERGCLDNFCTFEGRRKSITHLTGLTRKVPIPISVYRNIFVFPTHSLKDWDCCWIFYHHVERIVEEYPNSNQSTILFRNGTQIDVDIRRLELLKQLERINSILLLIIK